MGPSSELPFPPSVTLELMVSLVRSQRASFRIEGRPISSLSEKRIAQLSGLYTQDPALFWISCARWNPHMELNELKARTDPIWYSVAGTERPSPSEPRQDFSRGIPT